MNQGVQGIYSIVIVILSIMFVWSLLNQVRWDKILKEPLSPKSRMLRVVIAVIIGYTFASFLLEYWGYTIMLRFFTE